MTNIHQEAHLSCSWHNNVEVVDCIFSQTFESSDRHSRYICFFCELLFMLINSCSLVALEVVMKPTLEKLDFFHCRYGSYISQNISRVFLEYFHTTENISMLWDWTKLWKLDFPAFFCHIYRIFTYYIRGPIFPVPATPSLVMIVELFQTYSGSIITGNNRLFQSD